MSGHDHPDGHILQAYFDQELDHDTATSVGEHCADCARCRAALAELGRVQEWLAAGAVDEASLPAWAQVSAATSAAERRLFGPAFSLGTAAACAAGVALGLLLGNPQGAQVTTDSQVVEASSSMLWSGAGSASMLDVYSSLSQQEEADGS